MKIKSCEYVASIASKDSFLNSDLSEILLLGRSNVGKSSFINMVLGRKNIAYTSSKPGKTQTLNFYLINNNFHLVDAPGYGYAKVNKKVKEQFGKMIEEYLLHSKNLKVVFLLVDLRHDPTNDDILMYEFLEYYGIETVIVGTKSDKLPRNKLRSNIAKLNKIFNCQIVATSSLDNEGRDEILNVVAKYI